MPVIHRPQYLPDRTPIGHVLNTIGDVDDRAYVSFGMRLERAQAVLAYLSIAADLKHEVGYFATSDTKDLRRALSSGDWAAMRRAADKVFADHNELQEVTYYTDARYAEYHNAEQGRLITKFHGAVQAFHEEAEAWAQRYSESLEAPSDRGEVHVTHQLP